MSRAKEPPPAVDLAQNSARGRTARRGWVVEVAIPASSLSGWNPSEHPRIGFFYKVKDTQLGSQHLRLTTNWAGTPTRARGRRACW